MQENNYKKSIRNVNLKRTFIVQRLRIKNYFAFSLAETMVVMLIVSIILVAMAPIMTTRMKSVNKGFQSDDNLWQWVEGSPNDAYSKASKNMIGQVKAGIEDNALLILNNGSKDIDDILFKQNEDIVGRIKMHKAASSSSLLIGSLSPLDGMIGNGAVSTGYENIASGENSIVIGNKANASGRNSVAIGSEAQASAKNSIAIGSNVKAEKENEFVLGDSNSAVNIPGKLDVNGELTSKGVAVNSDKRLKYIEGENLNGLSTVRKMKIYNFTYKKDKTKTPYVGVIAQEFQKILPEAVHKSSDGFLTVRVDDIIFVLVNGVKELDKTMTQVLAKLQSHDEELKELRLENEMLKKRLDLLEKNKK